MEIKNNESEFNQVLANTIKSLKKIGCFGDLIEKSEEQVISPLNEIRLEAMSNNMTLKTIVNNYEDKLNQIISDSDKFYLVNAGRMNHGKSSLLNSLTGKIDDFFEVQDKRTTVKNKTYQYNENICFIDTPGLIPDGRISDLLPDKTGIKLVPTTEIARKTFTLNEGQVFMFSNLMYFKINKKCTIQVFASKYVEYHVTNSKKCDELMSSNFFKLLDEDNTKEYLKNEFCKENIVVPYGEDLCISGLGFIEINKGVLDIEIYKPKYVTIKTRESISRLKRANEEEDIW